LYIDIHELPGAMIPDQQAGPSERIGTEPKFLIQRIQMSFHVADLVTRHTHDLVIALQADVPCGCIGDDIRNSQTDWQVVSSNSQDPAMTRVSDRCAFTHNLRAVTHDSAFTPHVRSLLFGSY
jgi:hypothetical protein